MTAFALILFIGGAPVHMASFPTVQECRAAVNHNMPRVRWFGHLGCLPESKLQSFMEAK